MNLKNITKIALLVVVCAAACAVAQNRQTPRSGTPNLGRVPHRPAQQGGNFFDFVANKANPNDVHYGEKIEEDRIIAVDETIDNLYFWSNLYALIVVLGLGAFGYLALKDRDYREIVVSEILAFYHNQLVDSEEQLGKITHHYEQIKQRVDEEAERARQERKKQMEAGQLADGKNGTVTFDPQEVQRLIADNKRLNLENSRQARMIASLKEQLHRKDGGEEQPGSGEPNAA